MILAEKEAENFLERKGFIVVERGFARNKRELSKIVKKIGFPLVMKISGKKIIHKRKIGGVKLGINSFDSALRIFNKFSKIKDFEEVIIQKTFQGKEILLGLKKTPEFGHVVVFGAGGSDVEKTKDVAFRVCPLKEKDCQEIINDANIGKQLNFNEKKILADLVKKLCKLALTFPKISELDINPLKIKNKNYCIVDVRIVL